MKKTKSILQKVHKASAELDHPGRSLFSVLQKTRRIARKRSDYADLYWILMELHLRGAPEISHIGEEAARRLANEETRQRIAPEVAPLLPAEQLEAVHEKSLGRYLARRTVDRPVIRPGQGTSRCVLWGTVAELEETVRSLNRDVDPRDDDAVAVACIPPYDGRSISSVRSETNLVLQRIEINVRDYLRRCKLAFSEEG
jgi:hypothetical protein